MIHTYAPNVERWRETAWQEMPKQLKERPDAGMLLDKYLHTMTYESGGNSESALVPGSDGATGLMRIQNLPGRPTPEQLMDPNANMRFAWGLVAKNGFRDWGDEGATYEGKPFGALSVHPYGQITPPSVGDAGLSNGQQISPPGVDPSVHPMATITPWALPAYDSPQEDFGALLSSGDTPYAAGQDDPGVQAANEHAAAVQAVQDWGNAPSLFSKAKDVATEDIPVLNTAKDAVRTGFNEGIPGSGVIGRTVLNPTNLVPGVGFLSQGVNAVRAGVDALSGVDLPGGGDLVATQIPTTALDTALTVGPGNILKVGKGGLGALRGVRGAEEGARAIPGALGIIGKGKNAMQGFEESLRIGQQAYDDAIAAGKTVQEARAAQRAALTSGAEVTADKAAYETARGMEEVGNAERFKPNQRGGSLAGRARGLEEAMTPPGAARIVGDEAPKWVDHALNEARQVGYEGMLTAYTPEEIDAAKQTVESLMGKSGQLAPEERSALAEALKLLPDSGVRGAEAPDIAALEPSARDKFLYEALNVMKKLGDPTSVLRERVFGKGSEPAAGNAATKGSLAPETPPLPGMAPPTPASGFNPLREIMGVIGGMRTGFASGDMPVARQGGVLAWGNKKITLDAFKKGVGAYADEAAATAAETALKADPLYHQAVADGLHFHDFGAGAVARSPGFTGLNDSYFSQLMQELPWIKGSERATATFINEQAFEVYKQWTEPMRKAGVTDVKRYEAIADVINHAVGHSGSDVAKNWGKLNALFSAEYTFSRFNVLADPLVQMRNGNPEAAKLAAQNLMGVIGGNASLMTFMALTGEGTGRWSVNLNPTSGDFGQLRIGNTRYDTMAGFGPLFKTVARISDAATSNDLLTPDGRSKAIVAVAEDISKFFEGKEAPAVSAFTEAAWHGKAPDPKELALMYIPGLATGIVEAIIENNGLTNKAVNAIGAAIPGFGSVGVNTYSTPEDEADRLAQEVYGGRKYDDLTQIERIAVIDKLPDDAAKKGRQRFSEDFKKEAKAAGYQGPPTDADGKPIKELDEVAKNRNAANAEVYKQNPTLDVQRWFYEGKDTAEGVRGSGAVNSLAAANTAANLGIKDRPVYYGGMDRNLAATEDDRKALKEKGDLIDQYLHPDPDLIKAFSAQAKYKDKKPDEVLKGATSDVKDAIRAIPAVDAALVFFGLGGDADEKKYKLHSTAALPELQKLWDAYPKAAQFAKPGWGFDFVKGAK